MAELHEIAARLEKSHDIVVAGTAIQGTSRQSQKGGDDFTHSDYIEPPLPLERLASLSTVSGVRSSIIDAIARNTVGLGYEFDAAPGHELEITDLRKQETEIRAKLEAIASRDRVLDSPSFTELMVAVKTDEEETGQGYIEISRSKLTGLIDGIFHVPAKRVRRRKDRNGWALIKDDAINEVEAEFYNYGEKVEYDGSGKPTGALQRGKSWGKNELVTFRLYSSESRDYGLPRDVGILLEYAGDKLAAEYNVSFFNSGGTPPSVLFVSGEPDMDGGRVQFKVPQRTVERIAQTIKSDSGPHDRVAIIPLPSGSKTELHQLGQVSERDMGFVQYRKDNAVRSLSSFRLSPIFISIDTDGRYDAEVQRAITLEQVFDPEQTRYEDRLSGTIIKDLGYTDIKLAFKRLAVESDKAKRESADRLAESKAITRRELRGAHGLGPLPEAPEGQEPEKGQVPFGWNDEIVDKSPPRGAENRTYDEQDNRGLKPGLAGREQESTDAELEAQRERQRLRSVG
jgi:capsid portal protein